MDVILMVAVGAALVAVCALGAAFVLLTAEQRRVRKEMALITGHVRVFAEAATALGESMRRQPPGERAGEREPVRRGGEPGSGEPARRTRPEDALRGTDTGTIRGPLRSRAESHLVSLIERNAARSERPDLPLRAEPQPSRLAVRI